MGINKEDLAGLIADAMKDATGLTPEQFKERSAEIKAAGEAQAVAQREHTKELMYSGSSSVPHQKYLDQAKHIIRTDKKHEGAGLRFARFVRAAGAAANFRKDPRDIAMDWGDKWLADDMDKAVSMSRQKALAAGTTSAGGAVVPTDYINELIELLRSTAVVRAAGARTMPMRNGNLTIPRQTAAATASYVGENANIPSSQQTFDQVTLSAKKLAALTAVSNDLLRDSDPSADLIVRDDLVQVMALREDLAFLRGDGTSNTPTGLANAMVAGNKFAANATVNVGSVLIDIQKLISTVKSANVMIVNPAWFMTTRTESYLKSLRDTGQWVLRDEMLRGTLMGYPFFVSNQIPENLDFTTNGTDDETEITFAEMSQCIIGDSMNVELEVFPGGAYYDTATTSLVSGISADQTIIRTISRHDFALRHTEAAAMLRGVDWQVA